MTVSRLNNNSISKGIVYLEIRASVVQELNGLFDKESYTGKMIQKWGASKFLRYLKEEHNYTIVTTKATWSPLIKKLGIDAIGHHAILRLTGKRLCEWTSRDPSTWAGHLKILSQIEVRTASGKKIEALWKTHCELIPKYYQMGSPFTYPEGLLCYCFFSNDCFNYINRILAANGQPVSQLSRVNPSVFCEIITSTSENG